MSSSFFSRNARVSTVFARRSTSLLALLTFSATLLPAWNARAAITITANCTFTGGADGMSWQLAGNWSCTNGVTVPNGTTNVLIPTGKTPNLFQATWLGHLLVNAGATVNIHPSGSVAIAGNLTNNGEIHLYNTTAILSTGLEGTFRNTGTFYLNNSAQLRVPGTFLNTGKITIASDGGKILHSAESARFTLNADPVSVYTAPATVGITMTDANRNLDGTVAETFPLPIRRSDVAADVETVTMKETGPATGIFQSVPLSLISSPTYAAENGKLELSSNGTISFSYADPMDADDGVYQSASVTVPDTTPPSITLVTPAAHTTLSGTSSPIKALASDVSGIKSVMYQVDASPSVIMTYSSEEQAFRGTLNTLTLANGTHSLTVSASDPFGNAETTKAVTFQVNNVITDTTPPNASLTSPAPSVSSLSGSSYPLSVEASDPSGIDSVTFQITGGAPFLAAQNPNGPLYTASLDTTALTNNLSYTLTATIKDKATPPNTTVITRTFLVNNPLPPQQPPVDTTAPVVAIVTPANGATISGTSVKLSATATDANMLSAVAFLLDGATLVSPPTGTLFSTTLDTTLYANGVHTLTAIAKDPANNLGSSSISVTFNNQSQQPAPQKQEPQQPVQQPQQPATDTAPPAVSIPTPGNNAIVKGQTTVTAVASDTVGMAGVTFRIDGFVVDQEIPAAPFTIPFTSTLYDNGWHTISATARDTSNNAAVATIAVYVNNVAAEQTKDVTPPTVSLLSPAQDATISIGQNVSLNAFANDDVSVYGVKFSLDGTALGTELFSEPYQSTWDTTAVTAGTHTLTVTARDAADNTSSDETTLTFTEPAVPAQAPAEQQPASQPTKTPAAQSGLSIATLQEMLANGTAVHLLIKLPDDGDPATQEDSAVYYIGADKHRHAFSNSRVFGTWYCNFDSVQVVSPEALASIPLGRNIPYRPGVRMVKFLSNPQVYVVDHNGQLRAIPSEAFAAALYGADWNHAIDDISDAFYNDYTFGEPLQDAQDFNVTHTVQTVYYPSDSLNLSGYTPTPGAHLFACMPDYTPIPPASPASPASPAPSPSPTVDSDQDQLTDTAEATIGTDPHNPDTDGDGLKDGDEYLIYGTSPLNIDTDGDGYSDETEVLNGYNPLGSGKCKNILCTP